MRRRNLIIVLLCAAFCFSPVGAYAATEVPDMMTLKSDAYAEHTKGAVEFSHEKHAQDYAKLAPDFYEFGCGACHHDANGKPLANLQPGDDVQKCIECHKNPGEVSKELKKEWRTKKVPRAEQKKLELEYHAEAMHENCTGCHREYNKKYKTKAAPTTCTKCHAKE